MKNTYRAISYLLLLVCTFFTCSINATVSLDCKTSDKNPHYKISTSSIASGYEKIIVSKPNGTILEYLVEGVRKIPVGDEMALFGTMISKSVGSTNDHLTLITDNRFEMYPVTNHGLATPSSDIALNFDHQFTGLNTFNLNTGMHIVSEQPEQASLYFKCDNFSSYLRQTALQYPVLNLQEKPIIKIADRFTSAYIDQNLMFDNHYLGVEIWQNPFDMWVFQQVLTELKPDIIIETGTAHAGSTLFFATVMEKIKPDARIITVEIDPDVDKNIAKARAYPVFNRMVRLIKGDSVSKDTIKQIQGLIEEVKNAKSKTKKLADNQELVVLVTLDSLHSANHVLKELEQYTQFVSSGSYIVVQDTIIDKKKKYFDWFVMPWDETAEAGPAQAIRIFLEQNHDFEIDRQREKYYFTFYPDGFLKRIR